MKISDIAKLAGVSKATVSRVLNNKLDVNKETREKILRIIEKNNYYPNTIARNLSKNENNSVGVIIPDIANPFFSKIVESISNRADIENFNILLCNSNENFEKQEKFIKTLIGQRIKGIILFSTKDTYNKSAFLEQYIKKIPVILVDRELNIDTAGVYMSNYKSACEAVTLSIKNGHKNIAIITGPLSEKNSCERLRGYKEAFLKNSMKINEEYIYEGDFKVDSGYLNAEKIYKNKKITSVFISNNLMALGFLKFAYEKGWKIPDEISIFSFEKMEIIDYLNIKISSYEVPFNKIGEIAMDLLVKKIQMPKLNESKIIDLKLGNNKLDSIKRLSKK